MHKILKYSFLLVLTSSILCCSEENDCPDSMTVDIDNPESIAAAEACGLSPASPLSTFWVSEEYFK